MELLGASEAEKLKKQKWKQYCGTPCIANQNSKILLIIPSNNTTDELIRFSFTILGDDIAFL